MSEVYIKFSAAIAFSCSLVVNSALQKTSTAIRCSRKVHNIRNIGDTDISVRQNDEVSPVLDESLLEVYKSECEYTFKN